MITNGEFFIAGLYIGIILFTFIGTIIVNISGSRDNRRMKSFIKEHNLLNDYEKYVDEIKQDKKDAWRTAFSDK